MPGGIMKEGQAYFFGSGESYSTEEQVIGTWIDGKPLYRRIIPINEVIGFVPPTTSGEMSSMTSYYNGKYDKNSINIHKSYGEIQWRGTDSSEESQMGAVINIPWTSCDQNFTMDITCIDARSKITVDYEFCVRYGTTRASNSYFELLYIAIEYTKTTD